MLLFAYLRVNNVELIVKFNYFLDLVWIDFTVQKEMDIMPY